MGNINITLIMYRRSLFVISFICTFIIVASQDFEEVKSLNIQSIAQPEGMAQINVNSLVKDDQDYLWLATQEGLHRFNSTDFKIYFDNPKDPKSILDDHNLDLCYFNDTLLMTSMSKGLFGYKKSSDSFFEFKNESIPTAYKIFELSKDFILISSENKINLWNRKSKKFHSIPLPSHSISEYVRSYHPIGSQSYLLGSSSGLYKLNLTSDGVLTQLKSPDTSRHWAITEFQNEVYIGTDKGLYVYDLKNQQSKHVIKDHVITSFYSNKPDELWIGSNKSLLIYNAQTNDFGRYQFIDEHQKIYDPVFINHIIGDSKGNIWIATEGEGLFHYHELREKFITLKLKIDEYSDSKKMSSFRFLPQPDSTMFIGCFHNILKYDFLNKSYHHYNSFPKSIVMDLIQDTNGNIWAGGYHTGLLRYNKNVDDFETEIPHTNELKKGIIESLTELANGNILISTRFTGQYSYNPFSKKIKNFTVNGKSLNRVRATLLDSQGRLWLGSDKGIIVITPNQKYLIFTENHPTNTIASNRVFDIVEDGNGNIWVGTNSGITRLDHKDYHSKNYYKQKGLPNDFIYAIAIDDKNNPWVSTNEGIAFLDTEKQKFTHYSPKDGLQNNEFNRGAVYKDTFGNFYFGGIDGINIFHPNEIKSNRYEPKVFIESIDLFNQPFSDNLNSKSILEFKSHENVLTFHYNALQYLNPEKVLYSYKLEGFDKDWRPPTYDKFTTYTNLDPGNYTFKVKATNDEGKWSSYTHSIPISIVPPWYQSKGFYLFLIIFIPLLIYSYFRYRIYAHKLENQRLEKIIAHRTDELKEKNQQLRSSFHKSEKQKKSIQFLMKELQHRTKNNLQIISSILKIQSNTTKNEVAKSALQNATNRIFSLAELDRNLQQKQDSIHLSKFIKRLVNHVFSVLSENQSQQFKVKFEVEPLILHNIKTNLLGLIINELITNTFKYAFDEEDDSHYLFITGKKVEDKIVITFEDNGKGYDVSKVSQNSLGMSLVKEMVYQLSGEIIISSNPNGTKNSIIFPYESDPS